MEQKTVKEGEVSECFNIHICIKLIYSALPHLISFFYPGLVDHIFNLYNWLTSCVNEFPDYLTDSFRGYTKKILIL